MKRLYIALICMLCVSVAGAQSLRLSPTFATGMVLQQSADVQVWGWCAPNAQIQLKAAWASQTLTARANEAGRWSISVHTPAATFTPQTLSIRCGKERIELQDVLIGDVWFVGGQSNMQMSFRGNPDQPTADAQRILLHSRCNGLRLFRVEQGYALAPCDTLTIRGRWTYATPETVKEFSVVGYVFGKCLQETVNIPIGLVQSAHGGSTAEAWMDRATLERFGGIDLALDPQKIDPIWYCTSPMVLYNRMLRPLLPMRIKGVVFYQGESNVARPEQYRTLFPEMIHAWRRYFDDANLPFYYVQIAPYNHPGANSAQLREAQLEVLRTEPHVGMAVTLDVGESDVIHPAQKEVVGLRLAYWALHNDYGMPAFGCRGPEYRSMEVREGHAFLKFDYAPNGLSFYGKQPTGFEIAGTDRHFYPAQVRITPAFWGNQGLELWSPQVATPVAVRYGYTNYVDGSLYNTEGLPASSFRTDNW